jgi:IclR family transcriptional regulator, KDG regulon repressor
VATNTTDNLRYKIVKDFSRIVSFFENCGGEERSVTEISKSLQMLPSKVSRLLRTLEAEGFFERGSSAGKYRAGSRFLKLAFLYVFNHPLRRIILPHLEHMVQELGLSAGWGILRNGQIIVIDYLHFGKRSLVSRVGSNVPLHSSSYGKLFLAHMPGPEQKRLINSMTYTRYTPATISDPKQMRKEIEQVMRNGYALDQEETGADMVGIGAPIFGGSSDIVAVLSIMGERSRLAPDNLKNTIGYLTGRARFISRQLGYEDHPVAH